MYILNAVMCSSFPGSILFYISRSEVYLLDENSESIEC